MLPTSNARAYTNGILTREKATSISKTMSKFYKKPKLFPVVAPEPEPKPESNIYFSPKKELYRKDKKQKEDSLDEEELNYIGNKDDLTNLDFLFREATGYEISDEKDTDRDTDMSDSDDMGEAEKREKREKREKYEKHPRVLYPFSHKYSPHFSQDYKDEITNNVLVEFLIYRVNKD